jgi:hypothetical protein
LASGTVNTARVSGSYTGITGVGTLTAGVWNASAITDTFLATISTAGKVANSATTATSSNGASTIVARDANGSFAANVGTFTTITGAGSGITGINASTITTGTLPNAQTTASSSNGASTIVARDAGGNFSANTITANLTGNASGTAGSLASAQNFSITNGATAAAISINGTGAVALNVTAINASVISTGTLANARTTASDANGASTIVARDASGNFAAGTITATLSGSATSAGSVTNALTAGTGITYSSGTTYNGSAAITISIPQAIGTASNVQFGSLGVGTAASGTTGEIRATDNVTAFYSDERLKTKTGDIENALDKVCQIETMLYHANETAVALGYDASIQEVGVTAQSVQKVQPEIVVPAPIDAKYLTVRYEKLVPLLIEAIKELKAQVAELKAK